MHVHDIVPMRNRTWAFRPPAILYSTDVYHNLPYHACTNHRGQLQNAHATTVQSTVSPASDQLHCGKNGITQETPESAKASRGTCPSAVCLDLVGHLCLPAVSA